jgi:hypothetical protein
MVIILIETLCPTPTFKMMDVSPRIHSRFRFVVRMFGKEINRNYILSHIS